MRHTALFCALLAVLTAADAQPACDHALSFSGNGTYVDCGPGSNFQVEGELTVEAWVKLDSVLSPQYIAGNIDLNTWAGFEMAVQNGALNCTIRDTAVGTRGFSVHTVPYATWTHLAFTYKVGGRFIGYINGKVALNLPASNARIGDNGATHFRIGSAPWSGDSLNAHGLIDEVRVYNMERSVSMIREDMRMLVNGPQTGLVGYWRLSEGTGNFTADLSGHGHDGTLMGTGSALPLWSPSEGPYGSGNSVLRVCTSAGNLSFPATWLDMEFPLTSLDTFVVSRIDCHPNQMPVGSTVFSDVYWVVDRYGVPSVPVFDYVFRMPAGTVGQTDENNPTNLEMYRRGGFSIGPWAAVLPASAASATQATIRFTAPQVTGQLMIGTIGNSLLEVPSIGSADFWQVYPNPASNEVNIRLMGAAPQDVPVRLSDMFGRCLVETDIPAGQRSLVLTLGSVNAGCHRLEMMWNGRWFSRKLMVVQD